MLFNSFAFLGDWRFLFLIALTSLCSYGSGLLLEHYEGQRRKQRLVSASNIVLNIGILGVFKYYNFFVENLEALLGSFGWQLDWVTMSIILPVGISFYTFQALSYTIDGNKSDIHLLPILNRGEKVSHIWCPVCLATGCSIDYIGMSVKTSAQSLQVQI
jgi:D-alanyl-lipoteichoic acid acyltransferase DltB (MBOAT superfamily)